jgi:hypothetical protein
MMSIAHTKVPTKQHIELTRGDNIALRVYIKINDKKKGRVRVAGRSRGRSQGRIPL